MTAKTPFEENDPLIKNCEDKPTKIGVVIVKAVSYTHLRAHET